MQILTAATLSVLGYEADVVSNGCEAVAAVSGHDYVAVLMDCQMPEMDGYKATAEIRRLEVSHHRRTPIIALTATPREDGPQACLAAGMDDYLTKPARMEKLGASLHRWAEAGIVGRS